MKLIISRISIATLSMIFAIIAIDLLSPFFLEFPSSLEKWDHLSNQDQGEENDPFFNETYVFHSKIGYVKNSLLSESFRSDESFNILYVGDSVTDFGTFPEIIYASLSAELNPENIEYINFGTMGYNLELQAKMLGETSILKHSDLVVLQISPNDLHGTPIFVRDENGSLTAFESSGTSVEVVQLLINMSNLYKYYFLNKLGQRPNDLDREILGKFFADDLNKIIDMFEKNENKYLIVIFKNMQDDEYSDWTYQSTTNAIHTNNVSSSQVIDLYKDFQHNFSDTEYKEIKSDDSHFSQYGNEEISRAISHKIIELMINNQPSLAE
jgi:hypothetical protein